MSKNKKHFFLWLLINLSWSLYIVSFGMFALPLGIAVFMMAPIAGVFILVGSWHLIGFFFKKNKVINIVMLILSFIFVLVNWMFINHQIEDPQRYAPRGNIIDPLTITRDWVNEKKWGDVNDLLFAHDLFYRELTYRSNAEKDEIYQDYINWTLGNDELESDSFIRYWEQKSK